MADFSFDDVLNWAKANPGSVGALLGGLGSLIDPAKPSTQTTQQNVQLPDYIAPYAQRMLQRGEALSNEAYMPYSGPRVADFNKDQQDAFSRYRDMTPQNAQQTQGAGIVGQAAQNLLQNAGNKFDQSQADAYMSPYMQSVVDIQKREAQRDYDKQNVVMQGAAAKAGAFGGSRHGLVEAEAGRNFNQRLGDIQATGLQSAFTNAQGQFNADQNRMGQQYTAAAGAGNTLAGIGQTQFQNQLATTQGLMGIGNQQQGLEQKGLDVGYNDFLQQRQQPYDQFKFMQGAINGLPMTQTTTAQTGSAPSTLQQLISTGIGGYQLATGGGAPKP